MHESRSQTRRRGTEYLVEKLNALNLERSKDGESYPKYYVVNFTSGQMSVITLLMGLGFMLSAAVVIACVPVMSGVGGVLSLVVVMYLFACAVLSMVFAAVFFSAWLSPAENVIEIGYSDREMRFLASKIAEAARSLQGEDDGVECRK